MTTPATPPAVRLHADKNLDKSITAARLQARRDSVTIVLEKGVPRRDGTIRRIPILEITPHGDVLEVPAAMLRVPNAQRVTEADFDRRQGLMNARASRGHDNFARLIEDSHNYLQAAAELRADYRRQQAHKQAARANRHTTTQLDRHQVKPAA